VLLVLSRVEGRSAATRSIRMSEEWMLHTGGSFRQPDPIAARSRRMTPVTQARAWHDNGSAAR